MLWAVHPTKLGDVYNSGKLEDDNFNNEVHSIIIIVLFQQ